MAQNPQNVDGPSIVGVANHDPKADAQALSEALKGKNTDEKLIIKILTTRTNHQLQAVKLSYNKYYGDLIKKIKDEASGNFEQVCVNLLLNRPEYEAKCLYNSMKGIGTKEDDLLEIICTRTPSQLQQIMEGFKKICKEKGEKNDDLLKWVQSETSGDLEKLLVACLSCKRAAEGQADVKAAAKEAKLLYDKGENKWGTDEQAFIEILTRSSFGQISLIASEYEKLGENTLLAAIDNEMGGNLAKGLNFIVKYSRDAAGFWAEQLRETMKGMGTDDDKLLRIMITRAEIDLKSIRSVFGDRHGNGKTLLDWIKSDTSGHYEDILVALCLGNNQ